MNDTCTLCALPLKQQGVIEGELPFCCSGCSMVYQIIGKEKEVRNHPLFQEALKAGVISNPDLVEEAGCEPRESELKIHFLIEGMWCPACASAISLILMRKKGVLRCVIDYATDLAVISIDPFILSKESVSAYIDKLGYRAVEFFSKEKSIVSKTLWLRFAVALFCSMNIMMFSYPLYAAHFGNATEGYDLPLGWLSFSLSLPLITYAAWPIWKRLFLSFKSGCFGMEALVLIGVVSSFTLSTFHLLIGEAELLYYDSMSMLLTFVLLGKILEKRAKFSARETLMRLTRSLPKKGCKRQENGEFVYVPIKEIGCGDWIFARTGEKIILDGEVKEGEALVDEAVMTGEALPIRKKEGAKLLAGSILKKGTLVYQVIKGEEDSLIGQILQSIEGDLERKSVTPSLVSQVTRFFIPAALALACAVFCLSGPLNALSVLLICCPCAIGIAAPLANSRLLFRFAEKGGLVRNRNKLMVLAQNPFFIFDKTGTLTVGKFSVLKGLENLSPLHAAILKSLTSYSTHPISSAIAGALPPADLKTERVEEIIGRGMVGSYRGEEYFLGSATFLEERGIQITHDERIVDATVVFFGVGKSLISQIELGDQMRPSLPKVEGGILSGDASHLVESIAVRCGFLWGKGGMNPLQKREEILKLKASGRAVVMVGDGVNDAPAMGAADLGISVVTASDLAIEISDILMTTEKLDAIPLLCALMQKGRRIIQQNLFWAFFYNSLGIVLACVGVLNPLIAAAAMAVSSLCVTLNSLRI